MANKNAEELIDGIPTCVIGCFKNGVDATGCNETDYDCYCYTDNHQTIVDTMEICLTNRARSLGKNCTDDEMFQMENRYWMVCEQYWEPTGTATEPASATMTAEATLSNYVTSTIPVYTTTPRTSTLSTGPSTVKPESAATSSLPSTTPVSTQDAGLSVGAQAGIGIGVALAFAFITAAAALWFRERKKRRQLEEELAEAQKGLGAAGYLNEKGELFEMEGDRPVYPELRGDMRTPELTNKSKRASLRIEISSQRNLGAGGSFDSLASLPPGDVNVVVTTIRARDAMSTEPGSSNTSARDSSEDAFDSQGSVSLRPLPLSAPPRARKASS